MRRPKPSSRFVDDCTQVLVLRKSALSSAPSWQRRGVTPASAAGQSRVGALVLAVRTYEGRPRSTSTCMFVSPVPFLQEGRAVSPPSVLSSSCAPVIWQCHAGTAGRNTHTRTASEARLACPDREAANVCNFALSRREGEPPGSPDIFYPGSAPAPTSTQHLHSMGGPDASTAQLRQRVSGPLVTSRPRISRTPPRQSRPIHPCPPPARAMPCRRPNGPPPTQ